MSTLVVLDASAGVEIVLRTTRGEALLALLAAGASLGVVAETGSSPSVGGTAMRLASYTFALPTGYHRTNAAAATKCDPVAWLQTGFFTTNPPHVGSLDTSSAIASSASASASAGVGGRRRAEAVS